MRVQSLLADRIVFLRGDCSTVTMDQASSVPWLLLLLLGAVNQVTAAVREHYVAAVIANWNYRSHNNYSSDALFKKMMYREYEAGFKVPKPFSEVSGIMGPTLRAEVGDTIKVHFKNMADKPLTIHPQGITYGKMSEGSNYKDNTMDFEKNDSVPPGQVYTYVWEITEDVGPKEADPFCLTYTYYSHENMVQDINSGLIGPLLICKKGSLNDYGKQKHFDREYVLMFAMFDESKSWKRESMSKQQDLLMYTINGYTNGTMPEIEACTGDSISWHFIGISTRPELYSVHIFGQTMEQNQHKVSVVSLVGGQSTSANTTVTQPGKWLITSLVEKHVQAGMHSYINVQSCGDQYASVRKYSLYQKRYIQNWEYYIAAEEVLWDYAANVENKDRVHCQQKYKKAVYKQYSDNTFTKQLNSPFEAGLLGPVIRAQVRDTITVVFKNKASQPYSIYPHGVSIQKDYEGASYPPDMKGNSTQNQAVMPGETVTYYWNILETDEPTKNDPQCLTRMYHSAVNMTKDIASGLIGPLLICKSKSLNTRGVQKKADLEQIATFIVFDEEKSWYQEENKEKFCNMMTNNDNIYSYNSNIIHTINGYTHRNERLGFCHDHVVQWHVSSVGIQDEIIGVHLSGHSFKYNGRSEDVVTLFPMAGESISVEMDNVGDWLFGTLLFSKKNQGMKFIFGDAKCVLDDEEYDEVFLFDEFENNGEKNTPTEKPKAFDEDTINTEDIDYTDYIALKYDIRSRQNNTGNEDMEQLNLTALAIENSHSEHFQHVSNVSNTAVENTRVNLSKIDNLSKDSDYYSEEETDIDEVVISPITNLNITASDIKRKFHSADHLLENVTEQFAEQPEHPVNVEEFNSTEEPPKYLSRTEIYNSTDLESDHLFVTLVDDINDLNTSRTNRTYAMEDIKEINDSVIPVNISENAQIRNVAKRDVKSVIENSSNALLNINYVLENVSSSTNIDDNKNLFQTPENVTLLPESMIDTRKEPNGTLQPFTTSISPTISSTYMENETQSAVTQPNVSDSTNNNIEEDYEDIEFKEILGSQILEDIMNAIFHQKNSNETDNKEDQRSEPEEKYIQNLTQVKDSTKLNNSSKKHKRVKIKPVGNTTLSTGKQALIRRKKRVGNIDEKSATYQKDVPALNGSNETYSTFATSNNKSVEKDVGKTVFSPRGFKPQIIIGVPKLSEGDYMEYDSSLTAEPDNDASYEYVEFEAPYQVHSEDDILRYTNPEKIAEHYLRSSKGKKRNYYITAEEVQWDYYGNKKSSLTNDKPGSDAKGTLYTKVIYRQYLDNTFTKPSLQGELEEHLGILGPVIRAEVDDVIQVTFKNLATRPYSIHAHGISYEKSSEGLGYNDDTKDWLRKDDAVSPGETHVYVWYATKQSGPEPEGSACRTWAYYSGVNPERDIHSGLLGPLLICKNGTLDKYSNRPFDAREFILLFMTFEEDKSWYFEKNMKKTCPEESKKASNVKKCHTFHAINGIVYNLQGLQMYENELVQWHLLNLGGPKDIHVVHFHGQTFTVKNNKETQHGVYPLLPGSFATVEMRPSKAGLWLLDTEVAEYQEAGMQAMFLIVDPGCKLPMGLMSGLIPDNQISASSNVDAWEPRLARLHNGGSYNAWSAEMTKTALPWIQVDFENQVLITGIQTQGASKYLKQYYITEFFIAYSKDKRKWTAFKGNSTVLQKMFDGNTDYTNVKENTFDPPIVARYVRVYPTKFYNRPTLRMELLGCKMEGCSLPLGMENNIIKDEQITASSYKTSIFYPAWKPSLARLNREGAVNAWQAKSNNQQQWLQIDLLRTKRISGIVTQGAKSFTTEMYVKTYSVQYSENGLQWKSYTSQPNSMEKVFIGNVDSKGQVKNTFNPPIFSRFLKIVPKSWNYSITMRLEVFGCDI
ncbi:coagulation factor V [Bombina bombina]|uniref:coagulation factor V n=1 Tax=Bombina bombina TaxID=8345 RepID=UPI00235AE599|nr:coagulation factor V [Bombina bombina]